MTFGTTELANKQSGFINGKVDLHLIINQPNAYGQIIRRLD